MVIQRRLPDNMVNFAERLQLIWVETARGIHSPYSGLCAVRRLFGWRAEVTLRSDAVYAFAHEETARTMLNEVNAIVTH